MKKSQLFFVNSLTASDLSRFGREYIETGYFLERIFPYLGVRFVAIQDNYDTLKNPDGNDLMMSMKNIINSYVPKDISKKVSTSKRLKQERGELASMNFPYGYKIDPENHTKLAINPETAAIVVEIYERFLSGMTCYKVAIELSKRKVLNPTASKGVWDNEVDELRRTRWHGNTITCILKNKTYTGNLTQGKTKSSLYEGHGVQNLAVDDYITVRGTHEPIISEEMFELAKQELERRRINRRKKKEYPSIPSSIFRGKLLCADCGHNLAKNRTILKYTGEVKLYFACMYYKKESSINICSKKMVRDEALHEIVLHNIQQQVLFTYTLEEKLIALRKSKSYLQEQNRRTQLIKDTQKELQQNLTHSTRLFESFSDNIIDKTEFARLNEQYSQERDELNNKLSKLQEEEQMEQFIHPETNQWFQTFRSLENVSELTEDMVNLLIDKIVVSGYNDLEIFWNFQDECQSFLSYLEGFE